MVQRQPATESMVLSLEELGFNTGVDMKKVEEATAHFNGIRDKFRGEGILNPKVKDTEPKTLITKHLVECYQTY